jgi:hypothetical protein
MVCNLWNQHCLIDEYIFVLVCGWSGWNPPCISLLLLLLVGRLSNVDVLSDGVILISAPYGD